jgi:hypothetical protein
MFYNLNAGNPNAWTYVPDTTRPAYNRSTQRGVNGRVTWQATPKQKVSGYVSNDVRCICQQVSPTVSPEAAPDYPYPISYLAAVTWTYAPTDRLLVQAGGAARREDYDYDLRVSDWPPRLNLIPVFDTFTGVTFHATTNFITASQHIPKARGSLSYVGGRHEFKTGVESQWMSYEDTRSDNNLGLSYTFNNGLPISLTQRALGFQVRQNNPVDLGAYVQDKMTWNRLTLNGGLRFQWYTTHYPDMYFGPVQNAPNRNFTVAGGDWHDLKDLVPRMGAAYDLFGNGRTALKGSANKYLLDISGAPLPGNPSQRVSTSATRTWTDGLSGATALPVGDPRRGNFVVDCDLTNPAANGECGASSDQRFGQQIPTTTYDPATYRGFGNRAYNWEFSAGVQQQLARRVSADVSYFRRIYGNFLVTDNRAVAPSDYDPFTLKVPVNPNLPGGGGNVLTGLYDLNPSKTIGGTPVDNYQTFASNYGNQIEHWNGVDVNLNARLPHGITILGGMSTGRTLTDNCDVIAKLDNPSPVITNVLYPASFCHVETNFLTQVRAIGSYTIPKVAVLVAATFQSNPGPQILSNYVASNAEVMQSLPRGLSGGRTTVTINLVPPGTMYGERLNEVDLRFGKLFRFGHTRVSANLDLYNALNADTVLTLSNSYANWLQPFSLINARFAKVSAQVDF